jgi:membrane peptidoglycan carboxypeptidase
VDAAIKRRNTVIDRMRDNEAFGPDQAIAEAKATEYKAAEAGVVADLNLLPNGCVGAGDGPVYGFFCQYLMDYLVKAGMKKDDLLRGGYTIKTTMDPVATVAAKQAAEGQVPKETEGVANAMAIVQPGQDKHRVRALAANRDFGNDAAAGQSAYSLPAEVTRFGAGSIYKVFTAAAALEKGVIKIDQELEVPNVYTSKVYKDGSKPYTVRNYSNGPDTKMTLTKALATSPNTGFIILEERAGLDNVVDMAYRLGLRDTMQAVNNAGDPLKADGSNGPSQGDQFKRDNSGSFTLGPGATSVLELSNVAATIVSHGTWCPPTPVEQILDRNGNPVQLNEPACDQAVAPELADSLAQGMSHDALPGGTAHAASQGFSHPMIGKTGTTENYWSVAFMGATPQYAGAVMTFTDGVAPQVICDARSPRLCGNNGRNGLTGGEVAAPTWFNAMKVIHEGKPPVPLAPASPRFR